MTLDTKEDVVSFLEATRLMFTDKVGYKHFSEQLASVISFVEKLADENEQLRAEKNVS